MLTVDADKRVGRERKHIVARWEDDRFVVGDTGAVEIKLDITMANGKPNINNSGVRITWAPNNGTIPPHDEKGATTAWVNADFYRGNSMITRVVKNQPITSNATTITGNTPQWFDGIGVTLDLRDNHTTSLAL
ncbi:MAG TPA: hypothetical protein VHV83_22590 [Armatimonadota bacterium]|nr:hypothetical protein [Armatimonadota bacterium]